MEWVRRDVEADKTLSRADSGPSGDWLPAYKRCSRSKCYDQINI